MRLWFVLVLLMMSFASAVDIDFDCPDEIFVDEEFECVLEVFDGSGEYDVKVDLDGERNSVLRVWNDGKWESGYYYLKEFIDDGDDEKIKMKVSDDGDFEGVVKLRQGDKREFFDIELEVEKGDSQSEIVGDSTLSGDSEDLPLGDSSLLDGDLENDVISLNDEVIEGGGFVYVSKDSEVVDWLPYGFSLFLIFVIVILVWERR